MSDVVRRVTAIVVADARVRLRRPSSLVIFLVLCALPYKFVPAVSSGRTPMVVDGHRAVLTSSVIALSTASLGSVVLALLGFYLVSTAIRRDRLSRVGSIIAATGVTNGEYLAGKFLGNVLFLALVAACYMGSVMGLHLLRAERPLEPAVYAATYLALMGPGIIVVAATALLFECVRPLAGRAGDLAWFVVWSGMVSLTALRDRAGAIHWFDFTDVLGMLFMTRQVSDHGLHTEVNVGNIAFDPSQPPWTFPGIHWDASVLLTRGGTALLAVPALLAAGLFFARFDPARTKPLSGRSAHSLTGRANAALRPLGRALGPLQSHLRGTIAGLVLGEVLLTAILSPVLLVLTLGLWLFAATASADVLLHAVLPLSFAALLPAIADIVVRDTDAGTRALLWTVPRVKRHYVAIKFGAAAAIAMAIVAVPLLRMLALDGGMALSLVIGALFAAALAVSLGSVSGSAKPFAGGFLFFLYLSMSVRSAPGLDFAGWNGVATPGVRMGYAVATVVLLLGALAFRRRAVT